MLDKFEKCRNIKELLEIRSQERPDVPIFEIYGKNPEEPPRVILPAELKQEIESLGTWFYCNGYRNRHIAILGENSYEWILTFLAAVNGNNTALLLDTTKPAEELSDIASYCDADVIVYSASFAKTAMSIKVSTGLPLIPMESLKEKIEEGAKLLENGCRDFVDHVVDSDCMSVICCTSGTTGRSKGVMISHYNIVRDVFMAIGTIYCPDFGRTFMLLPLYHIYSIVINMFMAIEMGGTVCFTPGIRSFVQDYIRIQPELLYLVPRLFEVLSALIKKSRDENGNLPFRLPKTIFSGGATPEMSLIREFAEMGINVTVGYGLTETCAGVSDNTDYLTYTDGSMGFFPGQKYKLVDVGENGVGELCLGGDNIMLGYYKMDKETEAAIDEDGFLHTGDLAIITAEDRVILKGRKDRMMVLPNGLNVSPEEIEADIKKIDGVTELLVHLKDNMITAEIYAEDRTKQEAIRTEINRINKTSSTYREVENIIFRDEPLPKTASGKIKFN